MTNDEIDAILTHKVQNCVADKQLPADFQERLTRSIRGRRRAFRLKAIALIATLAVTSTGIIGYFTSKEPKRPVEAALIAKNTPSKDAQASGWMLFGFLRECFRRNRTNKRKEEEQ